MNNDEPEVIEQHEEQVEEQAAPESASSDRSPTGKAEFFAQRLSSDEEGAVDSLPENFRQNLVRQHRERSRGSLTEEQPDSLRIKPAVQFSRGAKRHARFAQAADPQLLNWVPIGPSAVLKGPSTTKPAISGRVTTIAISKDGKRVYAGTANGGVWRSDDGGNSWYPPDERL